MSEKKLDNQDAGYRDGQINTQEHLQLGYLIKAAISYTVCRQENITN